MCGDIAHIARTPRSKRLLGALRTSPEAESATDMNACRRMFPKSPRKELLGGQGRELARERQNRYEIDPRRGKRLNAILVGHKLFQLVRAKHLVGIGVEGKHERGASPLRSVLYRAQEKRLVSLMDTVEHAECTARAVEPISVE